MAATVRDVQTGLFCACRGLVVAGGELGDPAVEVCRTGYLRDDDWAFSHDPAAEGCRDAVLGSGRGTPKDQ